jgi:hypothetical protein
MAFKKKSEMTPDELAAHETRLAKAHASRRANAQKRRELRREAAPAPEELPIPEEPSAADFSIDDLLSDAEIAQIFAEAKAKVAAERKRARRAVLLERALYEERKSVGLVGQDEAERNRLDELVQITIDLPRFKNQRDLPFIRIDGQAFYHGRSYTVTVAQKMTLMEIMGRADLHVKQFYGESRAYFDPRQMRSVYQGGAALGGALLGDAA